MSDLPDFLKSGARYAYRAVMQPLSENEYTERREFALNLILITAIAISSVLDAIDLSYGDRGLSFVIFTAILVSSCALYIISRFGHFKTAAYIFIAGYSIGIGYCAYHFGADLPPVVLSYALLIIITSVLAGVRFSLVVTALMVMFILPLWYLQITGRLALGGEWENKTLFIHALQFSLLFLVATLVSWLAIPEVERSLIRARKSELELRKERNFLEMQVKERTEELKREQMHRLSQLARFAEAGRLAAGIIHDLLNPLTAIMLNIEAAEGKENNLRDTQEHLNAAIQSARRMERLVSALRKNMREGSSPGVFSLNQEIEQALHLLGYKAKQANVIVSFGPSEDIHAFGDPLKFGQVISNLVSNAIDSYGSGVHDGDPGREVIVSVVRQGPAVQVLVNDSGSGIAEEHLENIFDPFFTTKEVSRGTGLGLATVKHIVEESFGGTVKVESAIGEGSTFTVEFAARM